MTLPSQICPRTQTVESLVNLLAKHGVVLVRGTPASGKSVLAQLLTSLLIQQGMPAVYIRSWNASTNISVAEYLSTECHNVDLEISANGILGSNVVFVIDEAHLTYEVADLWYGFVKQQLDMQSGPQFCLFSAYGSPTRGTTNRQKTPLFIPAHMRVSLLPSYGGPDLGLCLEESEFRNVLDRDREKLELDADAQDFIYRITNGHVGMVKAVLSYLEMVSTVKSLNLVYLFPNSATGHTSESAAPSPYPMFKVQPAIAIVFFKLLKPMQLLEVFPYG